MLPWRGSGVIAAYYIVNWMHSGQTLGMRACTAYRERHGVGPIANVLRSCGLFADSWRGRRPTRGSRLTSIPTISPYTIDCRGPRGSLRAPD